MSFDFPDEDLMAVLQIKEEKSPEKDGWKIYFDRVSNALGRGVGAVLISPEGNCHKGFPLDLDDHKNEWSCHRSFLYGCDWSPGVHVIKLGIEILNLKQND